jgi:integrase
MNKISLYRDRHVPRRSPFWYAVYEAPDGKRVFKSTGCRDKQDAWKFALKLQEASGLAKEGRLNEERIRKIISEMAGKPHQGFTVKSWFEHWLKIKEQRRSKRTLERYSQVVHDFLEFLGERASSWIHHITSQDILAYRAHLRKTGRSARTANLSISVISIAFTAALRERKIDANPCTIIDKLEEGDALERDTFSPAQISKLVQVAEGDWKACILFGYYTGARLSDVANMRWGAIDWKNKTLSFTQHKTKKPLVVPLHPQLEKALRSSFSKNPGIGRAFMFPSLAGTPTGGTYGLSGRFTAIIEKAGIEGRHIATSSGRILSNLSFHSLRHSFTSALANAGVIPELRMKLTGHSSKDIHANYTHHEIQTLRAAVGQLPSLKV